LETVRNIYLQQGFDIKPEFSSTLQKYFAAEAKQVDFANADATAKQINEFISTATHEKIKNPLSSADFSAKNSLYLVNVVYFKGTWRDPFDPKDTKPGQFSVSATESVNVQMMSKEGNYAMADIPHLDAKMIAMVYKVYQKYNFLTVQIFTTNPGSTSLS
jgi:serine protease inhibitor